MAVRDAGGARLGGAVQRSFPQPSPHVQDVVDGLRAAALKRGMGMQRKVSPLLHRMRDGYRKRTGQVCVAD
jgi:hypothetical protein